MTEKSRRYPLATSATRWLFTATAAAGVKPGVPQAQTFPSPLVVLTEPEARGQAHCSFALVILPFMASLRGLLLSNQQKSELLPEMKIKVFLPFCS